MTKLLHEKLRDSNYVAVCGNRESSLVFVDSDEMIGAIKLCGFYAVKSDEITVTIRVIKK